MKKKIPSKKIINKDSSIFFATFSRYEKGKRMPTNGMVEPILWFLLPKVHRLIMLDLPHLISDTIDPVVEVYNKKKMVRRYTIPGIFYFPIYLLCKIPSKKPTRISYKIRDVLSAFIVPFFHPRTYDVYIALESINAFAGIMLKRLGKVKRVVYYVSDYSPIRFGRTFFNWIYLWLDGFCVTYADATWDVSPAMLAGRREAGFRPEDMKKVIHVPNALFPAQIHSLPISRRKLHDLVYMGILTLDMGPDLAIQSMGPVIKKYPDARLHIVGGAPQDIEAMKKIAVRSRVMHAVIFHGFVPRNEDMAAIIRKCAIGLAPYRSSKDSFRWYGDAGKIRQYTACGLPVVTTRVPPLGKYIVEQGAGLLVDDSIKDFSRGVMTLFEDKKLYKKLTERAIKVSRDNTWENVYTKAFHDMEILI